MHAAPLSSPRLQRVLALLRDGRPHSSRDIAYKAQVIAISSCVAELRVHGAEIICQRQNVDGKPVHFYTMLKGPKNA